MFVETRGDEDDVAEAIGDIDGIATFSRCWRCSLDEIESVVVERAATRMRRGGSFRVEVKHSGEHEVDSIEMAARLGEAILASCPSCRVDLTKPDVVVGVEIRSSDCYVFDSIRQGIGRREPRELPAGEPRFVVDQMLGRLVTWLRLAGFDALYLRDVPDSVLLRVARRQGRTLLTRDRELATHRSAPVLLITSDTPEEQLREVLSRLGLEVEEHRVLSRCAVCNRLVEPVNKEEIRSQVPEVAYRLYDEFTRCPGCGRIYWKGAHYARILDTLESIGPD